MADEQYGLTILIPTLDEAAHLPVLFDDLSSQQNCPRFEVIVVDGGSHDGTPELVSTRAERGDLELRLERCRPGRGRQLNCGARAARAESLLILHADSRLSSPGWLARAYIGFCSVVVDCPGRQVAAHHPLRFFPSDQQASLAYYYFAAKTALNLPETINGDQGLWIRKSFLEYLGGFDESLSYMEDARLARKIFAAGRWVVLDGYILSSPRRFESQGMAIRQSVNALLRLFDAANCRSYFAHARDAYVWQSSAGRMHILPFLAAGHRALWSGGLKAGLNTAWRLGRVSSRQIWQAAFLLDVVSARRRRLAPEQVPQRWLGTYQRRFAWLFESAPIGFAAAVVHCLQFAVAFLWMRFLARPNVSTKEDNDTSMGAHTTGRSTREDTARK